MKPPLRSPAGRALCALLAALLSAAATGRLGAVADACGVTLSDLGNGSYLRPGRHGLLFEQAEVANAGIVVGERCSAVIDAGGSPAEGEALRCAAERLGGAPPCYVILSHYHPDHALGAAALARAGAELIGHRNLAAALTRNAGFVRARLREHDVPFDAADLAVDVDRAVAPGAPLRLDLGDRTLTVTAHAPAHTDNDLSVFDDRADTLWLGDLVFVEHIPAVEADSRDWLAVLDALRARPAALAVPGHGPPGPWPALADAERRYLQTLRADVRRLLDDDAFLEHAYERAGASERGRWRLFDEFHKRNVGRVFTEMEWE